MAFPRDMMLGEGVFSFRDAGSTGAWTDVGATRGGGVFHMAREYRKRAADGDRGWVKGRVAIDNEETTLTIRSLEMLPDNINDFHPAMTSSAGSNLTTITSNLVIADGDYKAVKFTGKTDGGNACVATLNYALNMADLNWEFLDKNEVVEELVFTAFSLEATTSVPEWSFTMATT
jgi:hypothetical protein